VNRAQSSDGWSKVAACILGVKMRDLSGFLRMTVKAAAAAVILLSWDCVVTFGARTSLPRPAARPDFILQGNAIDRTLKGDRLSPVAPAAEHKPLLGCDPPFSRLAKGAPSPFSARCLT